MNRQQGFTLVEILVAMVIVLVMTGFVTLAIRGGDEEAVLDKEIETFLRKARFAQEEMLFRSDPLGIYFYEYGYRFFRLRTIKSKSEQEDEFSLLTDQSLWVPIQDRLLQEHHFIQGVEITLYLEGNPIVLEESIDVDDEEGVQPQVTFLPDTDALPFELLFTYSDAAKRNVLRYPSGKLEEQVE